MTLAGWIQIALFCAIVLALVKPLGLYMTRVFTGASTPLSPLLRPSSAASTASPASTSATSSTG